MAVSTTAVVPDVPSTKELPPPRTEVGVLGWLHANLFSSLTDAALTLVGLVIFAWVVWGVLDWAVFRAVYTGEDGTVCQVEGVGACWPFITHLIGQFMFGRYPEPERWRVLMTYALGIAGLVPLMIPSVPGKLWNTLYILIAFPILAFILLQGGVFGLPLVETANWGGLLITLVVASVGCVAAFPVSILLALGRRSKMPIVSLLSAVFIEIVRGVPLITVLFFGVRMVPFFLPPGQLFNDLLICLVMVTFFQAAYLAEVIRGGLQAVAKGQVEAANALGLSYWKTMVFIVLPQALKSVIPGIVNSFIALLKDTSLVGSISLFDLLGIVQTNIVGNAKWSSPVTSTTGYVFAAAIFWALCFSISRYSAFMEKRLSAGEHR